MTDALRGETAPTLGEDGANEFPLYFDMDGALIRMTSGSAKQVAWLRANTEEICENEYRKRLRRQPRAAPSTPNSIRSEDR